MNTYDPMNSIVSRHMPMSVDASAVPVPRRPTSRRLPAGYADTALRTRLQAN